MRLNDLLKTTTSSLKKAGITTPDLDARVLLEQVLQKEKTFILLHPDYDLTEPQQRQYEGYLKRRLNREPVSKILGEKEFWSLSFKTTKDTLDPRPDSETLIEAVIESFQDKSAPYKLLDLGTGTGCLLLALLTEYQNASGVAVDVSHKALEIAKKNAKTLGVENRVTFLQSNWCDNLKGKFDIIVSNPPYIKV